MTTLDNLIDKAKRSRRPLRLVLPPDPSDTECNLLCRIDFYAASLESAGERGTLQRFAERLRERIELIEEAAR